MSPATTFKKPIADLEKLLAESGPEILATDPDQHARLKRLVTGLKKSDGKTLAPDLKKELMEIYRWQLEAQRQEYVNQLESLKPALKTGDPLAKQAETALKKLVEVMEQGLLGAGAPNAKNQAATEKAAAQAKEAMKALEASFAKRLADSVKPVPGGVVKSPGGIALAPVQGKKPSASVSAPAKVAAPASAAKPAAKTAPAPLQGFRVMPGTVPSKKK
ncbi:MAG: hypothetical protein GQE15_01970 [Archangiaceae bacterium]|nr:hypothetical protein [Archangiaceae bacterium]